jgi:hypothetical protein
MFICFALNSCTNTEKIYYFYNANEIFETYENSNDTLYYKAYVLRKKILPVDSFSIEVGFREYALHHYYNFSSYRDTFFIKQKSYLDSIDYYNTDWVKKKVNIDNFWDTSNGWLDSVKIFVIEPIEGTDSIIFRKAHRCFLIFGG